MGFFDSLRSAFAGASAGRSRRQAPTRSRARTRAKYGTEGKKGTRTRAQLGDRYDRKPPRPQTVAASSSFGRFFGEGQGIGHRAFGGNWPGPRRIRNPFQALEGTRSQLAHRRATRAAQGYAATAPHPMSGEGARSSVRGVGRARGPARPLPGNLAKGTPVPAARRQPKLSGRVAASGAYIGRPR